MFRSSFTNSISQRLVHKFNHRKPNKRPADHPKASPYKRFRRMPKAEKTLIKDKIIESKTKKMNSQASNASTYRIHHTAQTNFDYSHDLLTITNSITGGLFFFGGFSENSQRVITNASFKSKFDSFLITGKLGWGSISGLPGYLLSLAEIPSVKPFNICYPNEHLKLLLASCRHFILRKSINVNVDTENSVKNLAGLTVKPIITYPSSCDINEPNTDLSESQLEFLNACIDDTFLSGNKDQCGNNENDADDFATASENRKQMLDTLIKSVKVKDMSVSYLVKFNSVPGKFDVEKSIELGIPQRERGKLLKMGKITLENGKVITASDVTSNTRSFEDVLVLHVVNNDYLNHLTQQLKDQKDFDSSNTGLVYLTLDDGVTINKELFDFIDLLTAKTLPDSNIFISHPEINSNQFMINDYATSFWHFKKHLPNNFTDLNLSKKVNSDFFEKYKHLSPQSEATMKPYSEEEDIPSIEPAKVNLLNQNDTVIMRAFDKTDESSILEKKNLTLKDPAYKPQNIVDRKNQILEMSSKLEPTSLITPSPLPKLSILGTFSSKPGLASNVSSNLIKIPYYNEDTDKYEDTFGYLDAGEGSYNSLRRLSTDEELAYIFHHMKFIYLSHLHADHLGGIITTINKWYAYNKEDKDKVLYLLVPCRFISFIVESFANNKKLLNRIVAISNEIFRNVNVGRPIRKNTCKYLYQGEFIESLEFSQFGHILNKMTNDLHLAKFETVEAIHCMESYSSSFTFKTSPGKTFKVSISGDTRPNKKFTKIGYNSDFLIHEATFQNDLHDHAVKKRHSTIVEALYIADMMRAKNVILTHFSSRKFDQFFDGTQRYINDKSSMKVCVASDGIIVDSESMKGVHERTLKESKE
ncbi:unnamed protein product [Hanseniaspora opuntiae]